MLLTYNPPFPTPDFPSPSPHLHIYLHPSIILVFRCSPPLGTSPSRCYWWSWHCGRTPQTPAFYDSNIIEILEQKSRYIASKEGNRLATRPCHTTTKVPRPQEQRKPPRCPDIHSLIFEWYTRERGCQHHVERLDHIGRWESLVAEHPTHEELNGLGFHTQCTIWASVIP